MKQSQLRPLVVEWPAADRAALETLTKRGPIAVRYSGCEMELLAQCRAPGKYAYTALTRKVESVRIRNADELYATLPLGAARLEAKLESAGELNVAMTIVGTLTSDHGLTSASDLQGDCAAATHVIAGLTVGAFDFFAGAQRSLAGEVGALGVGAGGKLERSRERLLRDGELSACSRSGATDTAAPAGCGAMLRVEVVPLGSERTPPAELPEVSLPKMQIQWAGLRPEMFVVFSPAQVPVGLIRNDLSAATSAVWSKHERARAKYREAAIARAELQDRVRDCETSGCAELGQLRSELKRADQRTRGRARDAEKAADALWKRLVELRVKGPVTAGELLVWSQLAEQRWSSQELDADGAAPALDPAVAPALRSAIDERRGGPLAWWLSYELARVLEATDDRAALAATRRLDAKPHWHAAYLKASIEEGYGDPKAAAELYRLAGELAVEVPVKTALAHRRVGVAFQNQQHAAALEAGLELIRLITASSKSPTGASVGLKQDAERVVVPMLATCLLRLGGPKKALMLTASPDALAQVLTEYANRALERSDLAAALEAYQVIEARAPETIHAPQAIWGQAAILDWFGESSKADAARKRLVSAYKLESPWADALRRARGADGAPSDASIREALTSWAGKLPVAPGDVGASDSKEAMAAASARVAGMVRECMYGSPPSNMTLDLRVTVLDDATVTISASAAPDSAAAAPLLDCLREEGPKSFTASPHGVKVLVSAEQQP